MPDRELRAFQAIVLVIALVTLVAGPAGGFGGLEGLSAVFGVEGPIALDAGIRNHLRAICVVFLGFGILMAWSALALERGRTVFRIGVAVIVLAGLARVTGWIVDGYPGVPAVVFTTLELVAFPLLFAWHARLLRRTDHSCGTTSQ